MDEFEQLLNDFQQAVVEDTDLPFIPERVHKVDQLKKALIAWVRDLHTETVDLAEKHDG